MPRPPIVTVVDARRAWRRLCARQGHPTIGQLAKTLGVSWRTAHRYLVRLGERRRVCPSCLGKGWK